MKGTLRIAPGVINAHQPGDLRVGDDAMMQQNEICSDGVTDTAHFEQ